MLQDNKQERSKQAIALWKETARNRNGYVIKGTSAWEVEHRAGPGYRPEENDLHKREWQFRIALYPTRDNLNKAVEALARVFSNTKFAEIEFKCLVLNDPESIDEQTFRTQEWNGLLDSRGRDRDQRGKEICINMSYLPHEQRYYFNGDEYKDLMLQCWKALIDAEVVGLGYIPRPSGDKKVSAELGLLVAFSYTAFKPYRNRHSTLMQTHYNPNKHSDPLKGVVICREDLIRYGIPMLSIRDAFTFQLKYVNTHLVEAKEAIVQKLQEVLGAQQDNIMEVINKLLECQNPSEQQSLIKRVIESIPCIDNRELICGSMDSLADEIQFYSKKNNESALKGVLIRVQKECQQKIDAIVYDLISIPYINNIIVEQLGITHFQVMECAKSNPVALQVLFRQLVHLEREEESCIASNQKNAELEIMEMADFFLDANFWMSRLGSHGNLPKAVLELKLLFKKYSDFSSCVGSEIMEKIFNDFKLISNSQSVGYVSNLFGRSDVSSKKLYEIFSVYNGVPELYKSNGFNELRNEWLEHQARSVFLSK